MVEFDCTAVCEVGSKVGSFFAYFSTNYLAMFYPSKLSPLYEKGSFSSKISSVNMTKFAGNCGFGHIYWRNP